MSSLDTYIDDPPSTEACATIEPVIVPQLIYFHSLLVVWQRYPRCHIAKRARSPLRGASETEWSTHDYFGVVNLWWGSLASYAG